MVTFIVLYFTGQTLNVFTLGGLALGIGRLVDDSIVELENIQRHLNTNPRRWDAILDAAREVAMPIFASTVTTVVVFLPIFFVVGIARLLLIPLTVTIAIALFTSFFVSRTVTPALCFKFLKPEDEAHRSMPQWFVRVMNWSRTRYESMVDPAKFHRERHRRNPVQEIEADQETNQGEGRNRHPECLPSGSIRIVAVDQLDDPKCHRGTQHCSRKKHQDVHIAGHEDRADRVGDHAGVQHRVARPLS